jgi:hypothetical protein
MRKRECRSIVDRVYPKIKEHYGESKFSSASLSLSPPPPPKVDYHYNICARITGELISEIEINPAADFECETGTIWIYYPVATDEEWVIRTLLHEYQHYLQDAEEMRRLYELGHTYEDHPFEIEAIKAEEEWRRFI